MATQSSLEDCYFYFYSSCTKGDECPFRHCELALGTETVCSLWREGRCFRSNCKFRHMESRIKRAMIPCYWENQPGGCRKPHCVFLHRKLRNGIQVIKDTPRLILPTTDGMTSPNLPDLNEAANVPNNVMHVEKAVENVVAPDPSLAPVPPLVLSFDEESDTESVTSTPVKQGDKKAALTKNVLMKSSGLVEEQDFGIKTLEQIRMEKIHKEPDSYYGAVYTSTPLDAPRLIDQHYPPKSEFLALPKDSPLDKGLPAPIIETKLSGVDDETDLRGRLSNRRIASSNKVVNQSKRLLNFKKQNANQVEVVPKKLDFKIKTLEEIRREKENKQSKSEVAFNNSIDVLPSIEEKPINNMKEKIFKKLKINRKSRELVSVPAVLKQDTPNPTELIATTHLVSNGIKEKMPIPSEELSEILILNKNSSNSPGKRKSDDDFPTTASKIIKLDTIPNGNCEQVNGINASSKETVENHLQPLQHAEIQLSSAIIESSDISSHNHVSTSLNLKQEEVKVSQSSVNDVELNDIHTSTVSSSESSHMPVEKTVHPSAENEHKDEISDKAQNSLALSTSIKSDSGNDNDARKDKDNLIDRSMSVDDDLDEFLGGDDVNIDDMDTAHNDDILLQIEEFLES